MFESMVSFVLLEQMGGMTFEPPRGPMLYPRTVSRYRRPFETKDGYIAVMPYTDRHWQSMFGLLGAGDRAGDARFATVGGRTDHIDDLYAFLETSFTARTSTEWLDDLAGAGVPSTRINRLEDLFDDPHLRAVGLFEVAPDSEGNLIRSTRSPATFSKASPVVLRDAPHLGEHTAEVLLEVARQP
jgi:crotonobetainyl-CoA:carnitine CoA-transferase CaiB-like acyl-CoA transferase